MQTNIGCTVQRIYHKNLVPWKEKKNANWLMEHLDGIKDTLEKELVDRQDDFKDSFELNYDETVDEMKEIRI